MRKILLVGVIIALGTLGGAAGLVSKLHAQGKPPVYVINEIDVTDPAGFKIYVDRQGELVRSFGGRFLTRGGQTETIAGAPPRQRVAIYEFENIDKLRAWREAPQQKDLVAIRDKTSSFRSWAVEGLAD